MAAVNIPLADYLQQQIEQIAHEQNCQPTKILEEAVQKYLDERSWATALGYGRQRGQAVGITTEEGIDQAIFDWRKQNPQQGR